MSKALTKRLKPTQKGGCILPVHSLKYLFLLDLPLWLLWRDWQVFCILQLSMKSYLRKIIPAVILFQTALCWGVSREERKEALAEPSRGLAKPSSSTSNSAKPEPTPIDFSKMGQDFSNSIKNMSAEFEKSLPKVTQDSSDSFLTKIAATKSELSTSDLSQITESILKSIQQMAELQIAYEESQLKKDLQQIRKASQREGRGNESFSASQIISASFTGSVRERIRKVNNGQGLFPSTVEALSNRAYNSPE